MTAAAPLVSLLLPAYNAATTLPTCLASIAAQTLTDLEVIAVDDGSTDATPTLLADFARRDPRVRVIRQAHGGIVAALNTGLAACRGRFVARMDADDTMHPQRLAMQYRFMRAHPECDIVGARIRVLREDGVPLSYAAERYLRWLNGTVEHRDIRAGMYVESPIPHPTFFSRRELYERLDGYRDAPWAEDYDLLFRAMLAEAHFGKVPWTLVTRTDGPTRLTRTDARCKRDAMARAKAHYLGNGDLLRGKNGVVILGSGPSGRLTARAMRSEGVPVRCFADNKAGPPHRRVLGVPALGHGDPAAHPVYREFADSYFAVCVASEPDRRVIVDALQAHGLRPQRDFARFV